MKLICIVCNKDALYVYMGKSLCKKHFDEWAQRMKPKAKEEMNE